MLTDIEIAQQCRMRPITEIAATAGIDEEYLEQYGRYKAKIDHRLLKDRADRPDGKLILVTAITPTEVQVDVGAKQYAYIKLSELSDDPSAKPEDIVKVGDEVETYVVRVNDVEGYAELSKKRLDLSLIHI